MTSQSDEIPHRKNAVEWVIWLFWWPCMKLKSMLRKK